MPRKSIAALSVAAPVTPAIERPAPPSHLSKFQQAAWTAAVDQMPSGFFRAETHLLLAQYCRHAESAHRVAKSIDSFDDAWLTTEDGLSRFERLSKLAEREGRALSAIACRLRMTPQARFTAATAATAVSKEPTSGRPWL
jgi:hypothetical protein